MRHQRRAHLEHARGAGAVADALRHDIEIEAGLLGEDHRLGGGDVVDRDEVVGDILHLGAVAVGADVVSSRA